MDNETGVIFNDEQGMFLSSLNPIPHCFSEDRMPSTDGMRVTDVVDDFAIPGAADAFGLWPSPWNYPAPGKK